MDDEGETPESETTTFKTEKEFEEESEMTDLDDQGASSALISIVDPQQLELVDGEENMRDDK